MSLLGLDIGTSVCKAAVFREDGELLSTAFREYPTIHESPGRAELDSRQVLTAVFDTIREAAAGAERDPVTAISLAAMGEAMVPVGRNREILANSILFTDSRGDNYIQQLREGMGQESFYRINPNILGVSYSMPKLQWIRDNRPGLWDRTWKFLLWPEFISLMLGGEAVANFSHANRTLLFDIRKEDWSDELLSRFGIPREKLPPLVPPGSRTGFVSPEIAEDLGLNGKVAVINAAHDQCSNALGAGVIRAGKAVCGVGTVECITPAYDHIPDTGSMLEAGLNVEHHALPGLYVSFIYNQAGSLVKWFRDTFAHAESDLLPSGTDIFSYLSSEMPADPTKLIVLPYFENTGAPTFIEDASGLILGLKIETRRGDILKAIMEGETFYFMESLKCLQKMGIDTSEFVATGGGARSDAWLQIKADILGVPFIRLENTEAGTAGAAMMAGMATGVFSNAGEAAEAFVRRGKTFEPDSRRHRFYQEQYERYRQVYPAIRRLL